MERARMSEQRGSGLLQGPSSRRDFLKGAGAGSAAIWLAACGSSSRKSGGAAKSKELRIMTDSDLTSLDPDKTVSAIDIGVIDNIAPGLVLESPGPGKPVQPWLASSWKLVNDNRWRFKLREGVTYTNGDPFDGEAVKWAVEHQVHNSLLSTTFATITHVDVVDAHTIDIVTNRPTGDLPYQLSSVAMINKRWMTGSEYSPNKQLGTGPGVLKEWVKGDHLTLEAYPKFWGRKLDFEQITYRPVSDPNTRANAAVAREADLVLNIAPQDAAKIKSASGMRLLAVPSTRCAHIRITDNVKPLNDKRVRQALNYAVDVPTILKSVLLGYAKPLGAQMQGSFARNWQSDIKPYPHDPERAKALLREAGYPNGFEIKLGTSNGEYEGDYQFVQALAGQLAGAGIKADIVVREHGEYEAMVNGSQAADPLIYWSSGNIIPTTENTLRDLMYIKGTSFQVRSSYLRGIYNQLIGTVDPAKRAKLCRAAILYVRDYCPVIFGYQLEGLFAIADDLSWQPRPFIDAIYLTDVRRTA